MIIGDIWTWCCQWYMIIDDIWKNDNVYFQEMVYDYLNIWYCEWSMMDRLHLLMIDDYQWYTIYGLTTDNIRFYDHKHTHIVHVLL